MEEQVEKEEDIKKAKLELAKKYKSFLGLTIMEAREILLKNDLHMIKTLKKDGEIIEGYLDYQHDRMNVETKNGKIIEILSIG